MRSLLLLWVAMLSCGGADKPDSADAPACDRVAAHLVRLAERDNVSLADPQLAKGMRAEFDRQCRENPWSDERRSCLAAARSQDATLKCPRD
jgi:hypothetical protein